MLAKDNDYDDVNIENSVVYEVEEDEVNESSSGVTSDDDGGMLHLEVNLNDETVETLVVYNEFQFEDDVRLFCEKHGLDDLKRKKLMKIVKMQLVDMLSDTSSSYFRRFNEESVMSGKASNK